MTTIPATLPNPFTNVPLLSLKQQVEDLEAKIERMSATAETGRDFAAIAEAEAEMVRLLSTSDPCRRAAESLALATRFDRDQIAWACRHDWFEVATTDGVIIVVDRFTYKGRAYQERIIWGGTFEELRDWAGY